jgi:hypothetical protein
MRVKECIALIMDVPRLRYYVPSRKENKYIGKARICFVMHNAFSLATPA